MLKICVARHGQNEDNAQDILNGHRDLPLTAIGIKQAEELACGIKKTGFDFDSVYSSPLIRAFRTAVEVCDTLGVGEPNVLDLLIERDFGVMTGKPASCIEELCAPHIVKTETITYFLSAPGAETFPELIARAGRVLELVYSKHSEGSVLLVTHGDFGKALYASYYGISWQDMLTMFHFGNGELLVLAEGLNAEASRVVRLKQYNN